MIKYSWVERDTRTYVLTLLSAEFSVNYFVDREKKS